MAYTEVRNFYGGLTDVSDAVLGAHVGSAAQLVADDGVAVTHNRYQLLLNLASGAFMLTAGIITGQLVQERVADVSARYGDVGEDVNSGPTLWGLYRKILLNVVGMGSRFSGEKLDA